MNDLSGPEPELVKSLHCVCSPLSWSPLSPLREWQWADVWVTSKQETMMIFLRYVISQSFSSKASVGNEQTRLGSDPGAQDLTSSMWRHGALWSLCFRWVAGGFRLSDNSPYTALPEGPLRVSGLFLNGARCDPSNSKSSYEREIKAICHHLPVP